MSLTQQRLLEIWEQGQNQHPLDQALTILTATSGSQSRKELAELNIGQRDRLLLALRERFFGKILHCDGTCPACDKPVEISFSTHDIQTRPPEQQKTELIMGNYQIGYRLPNSFDLAAVTACTNENSAKKILIERCLVKILHNGKLITADELPNEIIDKTEQVISEQDPQSEILLDLNCPECGSQWQVLFDIATFLWTEIAVKAKRLLQDVHALARAYGWSETDILKLSDNRRQIYLEMASS